MEKINSGIKGGGKVLITTNSKYLKNSVFIFISILMLFISSGCTRSTDNGTDTNKQTAKVTAKPKEEDVKQENLVITIDENTVYQTIESFGASGAWWSQDVGGWTSLTKDGIELREEIAKLLFDPTEGIGLSAYRYNIGAGSAESGSESGSKSGIIDAWRRAESFETESGVYDWTKDENAVWFLTKAKDMGVPELVFFCNSPPVRLTKNGKAYGDAAEGKSTSNLLEENYEAFANYVLDITEHFISEGYPIKYVSPVNEPQWDWTGGQEGCHYEPDELVKFLNVFLDVMEARNIEGLELSAPELGEWGNTSYPYYEAILNDKRLCDYLKSLDVHSYWSDISAKSSFQKWIAQKAPKEFSLKTSEWCEMVNGMDLSMDSAINLAMEINTDLTTLNVTSWQYWIATSCYSYRDGLIYVNTPGQGMTVAKRLWAMGNFSRFIRPGYIRIECSSDSSDIHLSTYKGKDEKGTERIVLVLINQKDMEYKISTQNFGKWTNGSVYVTDKEHELEKTEEFTGTEKDITIPSKSVVTILLSEV